MGTFSMGTLFFFFGKIDEDRDNKNDCVQELFVFFF